MVAPALNGLGFPLRVAPAEAAATAEVATSELAQVVAALADTLVARGGSRETPSVEEAGLHGDVDVLVLAWWPPLLATSKSS